MTFQDHVVMVTGAGRGIGKAIAIAYAEQGAKVIIADKSLEEANQTANQIQQTGGECLVVALDIRNIDKLEEGVQQITDKYEKITILINNAGVSFWKSPYELTMEEWDDVMNTNLRGTFFLSREVAKVMKQNGGGSIVNISSTRAIMSEPHSEAYAASKGGILALTHALAVSLGRDRIQVNAISPGWIETGDYEALQERDHQQHPANRVGKPSDIARACLYLTNPLNDFISGTNLIIDGGMTRKMIYEE
ncbi:SDR family NAD(P)-dependent oxidoreductase [Ammoniphilus sp. CFH 90114]|uniref:SDR family NAD(P)-dependent oxidoreductase n=1 Tax=Ammoniphilus sp. CFH 90114 TaxID=2493665 RepID=UPI00100DCD9A|nr:glucose 1-dehydrogenase [Ammoniphilus sp. CFH 90114]RXT06355.1 glucose 1-dehydrogenase [Ammoniphilus sp. CFH 90114]